ncbi:hypothetical protein B0T21DRAFT_351288 [Apiosordaria backusii]|uniref:Uncharacterized protein n=1 Tax=Apiosordaria backusii TaxID=314023 RepID=A0AA40DZE3_9PEZI|nr:hypothetical protein B0T21DRAFT_351288 [Apiosordaria backusii]
MVEHVQTPCIFLWRVVSGDTVFKSGADRDKIARRDKIIAFEMELAGVWDDFPCVVVKGVADYADSHKNKCWQTFAAATAAATTKALLAIRRLLHEGIVGVVWAARLGIVTPKKRKFRR